MVVTAYMGGVPNGVVSPKDSVINEIESALAIAERCGDDSALTITRVTLGLALGTTKRLRCATVDKRS